MLIGFVFSLGLLLGTAGSESAPVSNDVEVALQVAEELEAARAFDASRRQYGAVALVLAGPDGWRIRLRLCNTWKLEGSSARARECYSKLADRALAGGLAKPQMEEIYSLARYRALVLLSDDAAAGEAIRLIVHCPSTLGARRSLNWIRGSYRDRGGESEEARLLVDLAARLETVSNDSGSGACPLQNGLSKRILAELYVEGGRLRLKGAELVSGAVELLERGLDYSVGTPWHDDARFWLGRALSKMQRYPEALVMYDSIYRERTTSWFVGSYDGAYLDDALFESGAVLRKLNRVGQARSAYQRLVDELPDSRLVDDAAFEAATLAPSSQRAAAFRAFLQNYPESRYVRRARAELERL